MPAPQPRRAPGPLLDLSRVAELRRSTDGPVLRLGAGVTYTRLIEELDGAAARAGRRGAHGRLAPDPQPRDARRRARARRPVRGRAGGAVAAGAEVELRVGRAARAGVAVGRLPHRARTRATCARDELVAAVHVPVAAGPAAYAKVGARNAMARAVCAVAVALDRGRRTVGDRRRRAPAPTPLRAPAAEALAAGAPWDGRPSSTPTCLAEVGALRGRGDAPRARPPRLGRLQAPRRRACWPAARSRAPGAGEEAACADAAVDGVRARAARDALGGREPAARAARRARRDRAKNACEQGECGSCTVAIDGRDGVRLPRAGGAGRRARRWRPSAGLAGPDGALHAGAGGVAGGRRRAVRLLHARAS